jgi:hypothetical protein
VAALVAEPNRELLILSPMPLSHVPIGEASRAFFSPAVEASPAVSFSRSPTACRPHLLAAQRPLDRAAEILGDLVVDGLGFGGMILVGLVLDFLALGYVLCDYLVDFALQLLLEVLAAGGGLLRRLKDRYLRPFVNGDDLLFICRNLVRGLVFDFAAGLRVRDLGLLQRLVGGQFDLRPLQVKL